ncbi:MAG: HD domain-containing protein [Bacteroidetes bacterium]|nr:HD domain-containing protein [Bacteroidota bacterium]
MNFRAINKIKTINDPVYGFITIPSELVYDIMDHPWFQRLRRIKQLGLTNYVYPSAHHTRFQHALGAMHLMRQAVGVLRSKGIPISHEEAEGLSIAILLHDIGHGPFSHTLEQSIVKGLSHEDISDLFIEGLNRLFDGRLELARKIFRGSHEKKFLHKLVSSQLDMDRLDYLSRDSFFTGVAEGTINTDRIINMLTVCDDELVVESKGIYSIEKFIIARRLMYWQVYLHKAVLAADQMLVNILKRAKYLGETEKNIPSTPALRYFLTHDTGKEDFHKDPACLERFALLDDFDVVTSIKLWMDHPDKVLSTLCRCLINRNLFRMEMQNEAFDPDYILRITESTRKQYGLTAEETSFFVNTEVVTNHAYNPRHDKILIRSGDGKLTDVATASEQLDIAVLSTTVSKHLLSYPKDIKI